MQKSTSSNVDKATVEDFGREWARFNQSGVADSEMREMFDGYFAVFPWDALGREAVGFDAGCGTGRWATLVAPRVHRLHCVDASKAALDVARARLASCRNMEFHHCSIGEMPFPDGSMDFGYSLGVLHHMPDTAAGLAACAVKLKPGAPFLVYLYYAFDNRPLWFRPLWRLSDLFRRVICRLPFRIKSIVTDVIAGAVYWPLARLAGLLERVGMDVDAVPLSSYRKRSFYSMRTDALDRFGTRLEQRFTKTEIARIMEQAGLTDIRFSDRVPYWSAVGRRVAP